MGSWGLLPSAASSLSSLRSGAALLTAPAVAQAAPEGISDKLGGIFVVPTLQVCRVQELWVHCHLHLASGPRQKAPTRQCPTELWGQGNSREPPQGQYLVRS